MTDWYYHDRARGRVGPHTADEMRMRFRDRLIDRDTLVWHAGLPEWQPLDRQVVELDLAAVKPDPSMPPPLPPVAPPAAASSNRPTPGVRRTAREPSRGLSGCAIVAIALAALSVPMAGILAAIALPAYRDYTVRAKTHANVYVAATAIEGMVDTHVGQHGRCPSNDDMAGIRAQVSRNLPQTRVVFGTVGGDRCAFEFTLGGIDRTVDGRSWQFVSDGDAGWDCSGGDLPPKFRPTACHPPQ